jgi:hypothetical protein
MIHTPQLQIAMISLSDNCSGVAFVLFQLRSYTKFFTIFIEKMEEDMSKSPRNIHSNIEPEDLSTAKKPRLENPEVQETQRTIKVEPPDIPALETHAIVAPTPSMFRHDYAWSVKATEPARSRIAIILQKQNTQPMVVFGTAVESMTTSTSSVSNPTAGPSGVGQEFSICTPQDDTVKSEIEIVDNPIMTPPPPPAPEPVSEPAGTATVFTPRAVALAIEDTTPIIETPVYPGPPQATTREEAVLLRIALTVGHEGRQHLLTKYPVALSRLFQVECNGALTCQNFDCLKKGTFRHQSRQGKQQKRYLAQLGYCLTIVTCIQSQDRLYVCTECPPNEQRPMLFGSAQLHVTQAHGHLLPPLRTSAPIVSKEDHQRIIQNKKATILSKNHALFYPCVVSVCTYTAKTPLDAHLHLQSAHTFNEAERVCAFCIQPLEEKTMSEHWLQKHHHEACNMDGCSNTPLPTLKVYIRHQNAIHPEQWEESLTYNTLKQTYEKVRRKERSIEGLESMRIYLFPPTENEVMPPLYSSKFRDLYRKTGAWDSPLQKCIMPFIQPAGRFIAAREILWQRISSNLVGQLRNLCMRRRMDGLGPELAWLHYDPRIPGTLTQEALCHTCCDNEDHNKSYRLCVRRREMVSHYAHLTPLSNPSQLKKYSAIVIGVRGKIYGHVPQTEKIKILNLALPQEKVIYHNAVSDTIPVVAGMILPPESTVNYFGRVREILVSLRIKRDIPVFLEFFLNNPLDNRWPTVECDVRAYVEAVRELRSDFRMDFIILGIVPTLSTNVTLAGYLSLLRVALRASFAMSAFSCKTEIPYLPMEGILYSIPVDEEHKYWFTGSGAPERLRNADGTLTRTSLRRLGGILELATATFRAVRTAHTEQHRKLTDDEDEELIVG